jgi:hypothetical protein
MTEIERATAIRGKTMRWTWAEGPTRGESHEHRFADDGTVSWRSVGPADSGQASNESAGWSGERAEYAANRLAEDIYLISYLAPSGYTLTVAVNLRDRTIVGFASNDRQWFPVRGKVDGH